MDNWEGAPGAVVVVGGRAATREGQLLAWANDMETTIATQVCCLGQAALLQCIALPRPCADSATLTVQGAVEVLPSLNSTPARAVARVRARKGARAVALRVPVRLVVARIPA